MGLPVENDCTVDTPPCVCPNGFFGWEFSFVITGVVVMAFAPVIYLCMNPPPVTVKNVGVAGENIVVSELKALAKLLCNTPTFLILVVQGCFGGLPWSALQFRGFFFETAGLTKEEVTTIMTTIGFVGIFGGGFSGWLSDRLTMIWPMHGRIINAEFSVYGGIPFAFLTFSSTFAPSAESAFVYFFTLQVLVHLICGGVGGGTNAPILSQLASPKSGRSSLPGRLRWRDPSPHSGHSFSPGSTGCSATIRNATTHALPQTRAALPSKTGMRLGKL